MAAMLSGEGDYAPKTAVPIDRGGIVHHGPVDCVTARKIMREKGYRRVKARDCSGETYLFGGERSGRSVLLRVDREDGRITHGKLELAEMR